MTPVRPWREQHFANLLFFLVFDPFQQDGMRVADGAISKILISDKHRLSHLVKRFK